MIEPQWLPAWSRAEGAARVRDLFVSTFANQPAGVWSAPGRVNLIGEHTDYNAGMALPIALPHRTYVAARRRDDGMVRLISAQEPDDPWEIHLDEIEPGAYHGWGDYAAGVAWALSQDGYGVGGFDGAVDSCVPLGAALSSSAALECAIAVALDDLYELGLAGHPAGRVALVTACRNAENYVVGAPTGGLDQAASLLCEPGQALLLDFAPEVPPEQFAHLVPFNLAAAGLTLLVCDTRAPHSLVDGQYAARRNTCDQAAAVLNLDSLRQIDPNALTASLSHLEVLDSDGVLRNRTRHVVTEIARTREFVDVLAAGLGSGGHPDPGNAGTAGALMNASHASLRDDYEVTVRETDLAVNTAIAAGALGARMTGGGFGGSIIALVHSDSLARVASAIAEAFAESGLRPPAFLDAPPSAPAGRDL